MRFPILTKTTLFAASLFAGVALAHAEEYSSQKGTDFVNYDDGVITFVNDTAATIGSSFVGTGTFIKSGNGVLEIYGQANTAIYDAVAENIRYGRIDVTGDVEATAMFMPPWGGQYPFWNEGELVVESGQLKLSGYVNLWKDYGDSLNKMVGGGFPSEGEMVGVDKITILNRGRLVVGSSRLQKSVGNNNFVFLHNLRAGEGNDQHEAVLDVVSKDKGAYHVNIHIDAYDNTDSTLENGGSVGILDGDASVYKTGGGKLTLLNESRSYTGDFYVAGGSVVLNASVEKGVTIDESGVLASAGYGDRVFGRTLWNAQSLTLAGTSSGEELGTTSELSEESRQGSQVRALPLAPRNGFQPYKAVYFSRPDAGTLVINRDEVIRNFQSMFANGVGAENPNEVISAAQAVQRAADVADSDAPIIAGTGAGSYLAIAEDAVLAIYQEEGAGGIYKGSVCGVNDAGDAAGVNADGSLVKGGTFLKYGKGDFAFMPESANYDKAVFLEGGSVVVNTTALDLNPGSYDWSNGSDYDAANWLDEPGLYVSDAVKFSIVENATETLKMRLNLANVHFSTSATITTLGGQIDISDDRKPGTIELATEQRFVTGEVFVDSGVTLVLTAKDFAGYTDAEGNYRYYDKNGSGTYKAADGKTYDTVAYYKNAEGVRTYYYIDDAGYEHEIGDEDAVRKNNNFNYSDSIEFSGGSIGNAKAVIISGKGGSPELYEASRVSTLSFNNTNQKINNLTGDHWSKVELGRSTLTVCTTLDATDKELAVSGETGAGEKLVYSQFSGQITGVGNLIKTGDRSLTLDGGATLSYLGSTVLDEGKIKATKSRSLWNSSLIWMNTGTKATLEGAQNLVALAGGQDALLIVGSEEESDAEGEPTVKVSPNDLCLGMDASRREVLNSAYQATDGETLGIIITDDLGNSDRVLKTYKDSDALVRSYLKPILDFRDAGLTQEQADALVDYFKGGNLGANLRKELENLFDREVSQSSPLTVADVTRLYVKLLAQNSSGSNKMEGADVTEMVNRLSFNGELQANNITKIGDDRVTIAGKISAKSLKIEAGAFEMDADAYGETDFSDGISALVGATLSINTGSDVEKEYTFDKAFSGDGNFEKKGAASLTLGASVNYFGKTIVSEGDLTMSLRSRSESDVKAQGDIEVNDANSTLTLNQTEKSVEWAGMLTNSGSLVKDGSGSLSLNGSVSLSGDLRVEEGVLMLKDAEFNSNGKKVVVDANTELKLESSEGASSEIDRVFMGDGVLTKLGTGELTLANSSNEAGVFSGKLAVEEGDLYLASDKPFGDGSSVIVTVAENGTLHLSGEQEFVALGGTGAIFLNTSEETALELALANEDSVAYTNGGGVYVTTVNRNVSTDYSSFIAYEGQIDVDGNKSQNSQLGVGGRGSFVFNGELLYDRIGLSVEDSATLITSALDCDIVLEGKDARVILATDAKDARLDGEITANGLVAGETFKVGKLGTGVLTVESSNSSSWTGADLLVFEGTLQLEGADAFNFNSAMVSSGATLALDCSAYGVNVDLSEIEGSGTISLIGTEKATLRVLNLTGTTMLDSDAVAGGRYFNGILDAGTFDIFVAEDGVKLAAIQTQGGFDSSGVVEINQNHDTTIGGSFSANVIVSGQGCLNIEDVQAVGTILVDNGKVRVNSQAATLGEIYVKNNATVYFAEDSTGSESLAALKVDLEEGDKAGTVTLVKSGMGKTTLAFDAVSDGGQDLLAVSDGLWKAATDANGATRLLLGVNQGELVLSGLKSLNSSIGLATFANKGALGLKDRLVVFAGDADEALNRSISGNGNVAFEGTKTTSVTANQSYTGSTFIESGATVDFDNVSLATSKLLVVSGGTMKGGVKLTGAKSIETRATLSTASDVVGGDFVNNGTVLLDVSVGDCIEYAGTFTNNGVIRLTGAAATTRGHELILFKSLSGKTYSTEDLELLFGNGKLTNGATALMLSQNDSSVISAYAIGTSFAETEGLHDGLAGSFTDVLNRMGGVDDAALTGIVFESELLAKWGPIGAALNQTSAGALPGEIAKLSPIGYASMIAMARNSFENDWRAIAERASHRRYDSSNELYDNGVEFFARAQASVVESAGNRDSANFDFNTYGAIVGFDVKPDDFSLYGFTVGYDYGSATLHDGGGKVYSDSFRAAAFASGLLGDGTVFLDVGAHFGFNDYETERNTLVGESKGNTDGWNAGLSATLGKGFVLSRDKNLQLSVTPYLGLSYLFTKVNSFDESGVAGLDVDAFDAHSVRGRLGATFDWKFPLGDWEARVSLDVAYHHEFMDDEADIEAQFRQYRDSAFEVSGVIAPSDAFSLAPSMTIDLSERDSLSFGYMLQYGTDEQINHNFNAGFRHCF